MISKDQEIHYVDSKQVSCEGNGSKIGHPLIYLNMGKYDNIKCPYCNVMFKIIKQDQ